MEGIIRKIVVGDSYSFCVKYVKGSEYRVGDMRCKLSSIIKNKEKEFDIYLINNDSQFLWKTVKSNPLEIEYDVNFD